MSRFEEYVKTMVEESAYDNSKGEVLFVERRDKGYYAYTDKYDVEFKNEKELKTYLKKYGFEWIGEE